MQNLVPADLLHLVFECCNVQTLGKHALVCKGAAQQTWSNAPVIVDLPEMLYPFNIVYQYISKKLQEVSLEHSRQFPTILQHLLDHCHRLTHLKIAALMLLKYRYFILPKIAALLARVTNLTLTSLTEGKLQKMCECLDEISACHGSTLEITHLNIKIGSDRIDFSPQVARLTAFMKALPRLVHVDLSIALSRTTLIQIFSGCRHLKLLQVSYVFKDWENSFFDLIKKMSDTAVGINIRIASEGILLATSEMRQNQCPSGAAFFSQLSQCGLSRLEPEIAAQLLTDHVSRGMLESMDQILELMTLKSYPQLLPPLESVIPYLSVNFWCFIVDLHSTTLLQRFVEMFRLPDTAKHSMLLRAVELNPFDEALADMILTSNDHLSIKSIFGAALIRQHSTPQALRWVLNQMDEKTVCQIFKEDHQGQPLVLGLLRTRRPIVDTYFRTENMFLCFNNSYEWLHSLSGKGNDLSTWPLFKRIIECVEVVHPILASNVLGWVIGDDQKLQYWLRFIEERRLQLDFSPIEQGSRHYLHRPMEDSLSYFLSAPLPKNMISVLLKHAKAFVSSFIGLKNTKSSVSDTLLPALACFVQHFRKTKHARINAVINSVFMPSAQILARRGLSSSAGFLLSFSLALHRFHPSFPVTESPDLLQLCFDLDFSHELPPHVQESNIKHLANALSNGCSSRPTNWFPDFYFPCARRISGSVLNQVYGPRSRWFDCIFFKDWTTPSMRSQITEEHISDLVRKGARISNTEPLERLAAGYDEVLVEIYEDALLKLNH